MNFLFFAFVHICPMYSIVSIDPCLALCAAPCCRCAFWWRRLELGHALQPLACLPRRPQLPLPVVEKLDGEFEGQASERPPTVSTAGGRDAHTHTSDPPRQGTRYQARTVPRTRRATCRPRRPAGTAAASARACTLPAAPCRYIWVAYVFMRETRKIASNDTITDPGVSY